MSMCFVLLWNTGLEAICNADLLSHNKAAVEAKNMCKLLSRAIIQTISHVTLAILLYSASAEEREAVVCFLDFQETRELNIKIQKPVTDLLESGKVAQSAFVNSYISIKLDMGKNKPCQIFAFM